MGNHKTGDIGGNMSRSYRRCTILIIIFMPMGILGLIDRRVKPWFGRTKWYARLREGKQMIEGQGGKRKDNIIRF